MTKLTENDAYQLAGWTISNWSLLPTKLFTLELINFVAPAGESRNLAKIICTRPSSVSMQGFSRLPGQEISISLARLNYAGNSTQLEIEVARGGRAAVVAESLDLVFY